MYTSCRKGEFREVSVCDAINVSPRAIGGWRGGVLIKFRKASVASGQRSSMHQSSWFTYHHTPGVTGIASHERTIAKTLIRNLQ